VDLVNAIYRANQKTIVVLKASFPYAINAIQQSIPAILYMAHSSQEEGHALADVLFGDYNPGGRLVQTWVKSVADLPDMMDYSIRKGRTYMYFKGEPLYPFGFGLSYTRFEYSGTRAGDEVVQLYVEHIGSSVERPTRQLRGFQRITLKPGETRTIRIPLKGADLAYWDVSKHDWVVEKERVKILVGASSADARLDCTIDVTAM
jgi:beta-glucosidase